jgi:hypothetical protein
MPRFFEDIGSSSLEPFFYIERRISIEASSSVVWNVISNLTTYQQWCDFYLTGRFIHENAVLTANYKGLGEYLQSRNFQVTEFVEPITIEFSNFIGGNPQRYIIFQLNQLDENKTEVIYKRSHDIWLVAMMLIVWIIMYSTMWALSSFPLAAMVPLVVGSIFAALGASIYIYNSSIITLDGSLVKLNRLISTSSRPLGPANSTWITTDIPPSSAPYPAHAEYVMLAIATPIEVCNPLFSPDIPSCPPYPSEDI